MKSSLADPGEIGAARRVSFHDGFVYSRRFDAHSEAANYARREATRNFSAAQGGGTAAFRHYQRHLARGHWPGEQRRARQREMPTFFANITTFTRFMPLCYFSSPLVITPAGEFQTTMILQASLADWRMRMPYLLTFHTSAAELAVQGFFQLFLPPGRQRRRQRY